MHLLKILFKIFKKPLIDSGLFFKNQYIFILSIHHCHTKPGQRPGAPITIIA